MTAAEKAARRIAVPMDIVIASLAKCIVCDEPESDKYRHEVEYWLEQLVANIQELARSSGETKGEGR